MSCEDCNQREAEYRVDYVGGGNVVLCQICVGFNWPLIDIWGNAKTLTALDDGRLIKWGGHKQT